MASNPKTPKTRDDGPFKVTPGKAPIKPSESADTHKGAVPILYASWQLVPGAVSLIDWDDQVHRAVRTKHPEVADQMKTLERREIEIPEEPVEPEVPAKGSDQDEIEMYRLQVQIYLSKMQVHGKALVVYQSKVEKAENNEKACAAEILAYVSDPLIQKVKQDIPELDICSDIPRIIIALKKYHAETNAKSARRILLHAYMAHAMIKMQPTETLFSYYKRYQESMRKTEEGGAQPFNDDLEAIKFIESLLPERYGEWQMTLVNREHDAQASGLEESPWPKTVSEAYAIASARLTSHSKRSFDIDAPTASTINKIIGRQPDSEGRGGGLRNDQRGRGDDDSPPFKFKTHAAKPERTSEPDTECFLCDGLFNYLTKDQKHWCKSCPLVTISHKDKKALMAKMLQRDDDKGGTEEKTGTANRISKRHGHARYSDSDSEDDGYATLMGTADR